ncbi:nucleotidyl transferase AbiEii/AbiGii toxin family protein [Streptomyces sp. NPDC001868]|uniref:nucleotidyl transferase AbiEii/AbiGii toxin family protein n=1 Tax=Streptomyces sp. NPDC001868 TaxID=3154401 RepID=UPI003316F262
MASSQPGNDWRSRSLADQQYVEAVAITLHSFREALDPSTWYLKGSAALTAWIGPASRLPNDVDLVLPIDVGRRLLASNALPLGPRGESLRVVRHEPVVFSSAAAPTVYRALVDIRGPERLPAVPLGLLLVPEADARNDERVTLLDFPGPTGAVTVRSVTGYRFLAQKLMRYTHQRSSGRINTHWWDLSDMLLAVSHPAFPALQLARLYQSVITEIADHGVTFPTALPGPPAEWLDFWDTATFLQRLPFGRLSEAADRLGCFWDPVLKHLEESSGNPVDTVWMPDKWGWVVL